ncbi:hypothetical protein D3C85_938110 [compost metagenome]
MADMFDRLRAMTIKRLKPHSSGGHGMPGTLVRKEYMYNPDTDMNEVRNTSYAISGLRASYALRHVDGELIRMSDVKFYLCPVLISNAACPTPMTTDQIQLDGTTFTVISVSTWNNAGVECGWQVQLRTG